jgi:phosphoribosyl-ATP pyrophosphohydrolase
MDNQGNKDIIRELYDVVVSRKDTHEEGSYTCYLFDKGLDKILKKVGEESAETIIAAKNSDTELLTGEICDLIYHLTVLMVERGVPLDAVYKELDLRAQKMHNLKTFHSTDKNS